MILNNEDLKLLKDHLLNILDMEEGDYKDWCCDNGYDPDAYKENVSHPYAFALVFIGKLENI